MWVDRLLATVGLMRKSQNPVVRLEVSQPKDTGRRTVLIELKNGLRWSGYLDPWVGNPLTYPENPLVR